jgi:hypothetical protein
MTARKPERSAAHLDGAPAGQDAVTVTDTKPNSAALETAPRSTDPQACKWCGIADGKTIPAKLLGESFYVHYHDCWPALIAVSKRSRP